MALLARPAFAAAARRPRGCTVRALHAWDWVPERLRRTPARQVRSRARTPRSGRSCRRPRHLGREQFPRRCRRPHHQKYEPRKTTRAPPPTTPPTIVTGIA